MDQNQQGPPAPPAHYAPGIGLDIGTSFLQVARERADEKTEFVSERDAFYAIKPSSAIAAKFVEKSLTQKGAFFLKSGGTFYVVGKQAIETAIERGGTVERPLKRGVLSMRDKDSMGMLAVLIEALVRNSQNGSETCVYSYPADPVDEDFDVIYHQNRMSEILGTLGYKAVPLLEAEALAYSELMADDLTGIAISCGAGMHNLAVFHVGECILSFSIAQGGDYIDRSVAKPLGISETEVQAEKESPGMDLNNPKGQIQETIVMYYDNLIKYVCEVLEKKFSKLENVPKFGKPVPVVVSGGTSIPNGFLEKMATALKSKSFPFEIGEVRKAKDPLTAVANGCLIYAQMMRSE
jgi:hypothetical protein